MMIRRYALTIAITLLAATGWHHGMSIAARQRNQSGQAAATSSSSGRSATRLPDGRWLVAGGREDGGKAVLWDPLTGTTTPTAGPMQTPRAGHAATLLSDGTVLLVGGRNDGALADTPEIFDPATNTFTSIPIVGATARASHSATLLSDGRVLIVGGSNGSGTPLASEIWDVATGTATRIGSEGISRSNHTATLMADGRVLIARGAAFDGTPLTDAVAIDPLQGGVQSVEGQNQRRSVPSVTASTPEAGSTDVPLDTRLALRFSDALAIESVTTQTIVLSGPEGAVATRVIVAEDGRLAFIWPAGRLTEATTYRLHVSGAVDRFGVPIVPWSVAFTTTEHRVDSQGAGDPEEWIPDATSVRNGWRANRAPSPWESLAPLMAPPGVTAISGRVLTLDGRPLPSVTLEMDGAETRSDRTGRFLLLTPSVGGGRHVLDIQGETASRLGRQYGFFEFGMTVTPGQTTVLPFTIWMPKLDTRHVVTIPSPTTGEVVVTTPLFQGSRCTFPPVP